MTKRRLGWRALPVALGLFLAASCTTATPVTPSAGGSTQHRVLYALDGHGDGGVLELDAATGVLLGGVAPAQRNGRRAVSVARLNRQALMVAYGRTPRLRSNVAGGDPEPGTCGGEVDLVALRGGRVTTLWTVPPTTLLRQADPDPDGRRVALSVSPCVPSYLNPHIEVTDLHGLPLSSMGDSTARCHIVGPVSWTGDGKQLLFLYAPAAAAAAYAGRDGTCDMPGRAGVTTVDVAPGRAELPELRWYAAAGCQLIAAAAAPAGGAFAVQTCGRGLSPTALINLTQLSSIGEVEQTWNLGNCGVGADLSVARDGTAAVSGYFYCGGTDTPRTRLFRAQSDNPKILRTVAGGTLAFSSLAW